LLLIARRVASKNDAIERGCTALGEELCSVIRNERLRTLLVCSPQTAATLGAGHVFLMAAGFPNPEFESLVSEALDGGFAGTVERVPYRLMDQRWTQNLIGGAQPFDDLLPFSILSGCAHAFYMTPADAYAVTHSIMYLTDFGRSDLPAAAKQSSVKTMVEAGLAWNIVSEDFDMLAEFLINAECLDLQYSGYAKFAWEVVDRVWLYFGFLPGPTFDIAKYRSLVKDNAAAYAFQQMYHTIFVSGMLCAVALYRSVGGVDAKSPPIDDPTPLEQLLAYAFNIRKSKINGASPWVSALCEVSPRDESVIPVVLDGVLIEAARQDDWRILDQVLKHAQACGWVDTPTVRAARWLRDRLRRHRLIE
jgi:hypothetical protein